jgi:hypothetical protein
LEQDRLLQILFKILGLVQRMDLNGLCIQVLLEVLRIMYLIAAAIMLLVLCCSLVVAITRTRTAGCSTWMGTTRPPTSTATLACDYSASHQRSLN